jgi:hypothetical protein
MHMARGCGPGVLWLGAVIRERRGPVARCLASNEAPSRPTCRLKQETRRDRPGLAPKSQVRAYPREGSPGAPVKSPPPAGNSGKTCMYVESTALRVSNRKARIDCEMAAPRGQNLAEQPGAGTQPLL